MHKTTILCQFGLSCHQLTTISPSILNHFWWELYHATSIKPFQRHRDVNGAWNTLTSQYAGKDKWEAEIKKQEQLLHTRVWKGQSNFSLEHFISQHRNAYISMPACAEHVQYQLPIERSRVGFLIDAIECADAGLQATMASVKTDNSQNGLWNNFERAVSHLLPYDPVAKKQATGVKGGSALISLAEANNGYSTTIAAKIRHQVLAKQGYTYVTTNIMNTRS